MSRSMTSGEPWTPWRRSTPELLARYVSHAAAAAAVPEGFFRLSADGEGFRSLHDLRAQGRMAEAVGALYERLCGLGIEYELEPVSLDDPAEVWQRIRTPEEIVREGRGTCLDLALLFAGLCVEARLLPTVVLLEDAAGAGRHAMVLVDGQCTADDYDLPRGWPEEARTRGWWSGDAARRQLLAWVDAEKDAALAVECTGFARTLADGRADPTLPFAQACRAGRRRLAEMELEAAVDVLRLQRGRGHPLAVPADEGGTPRERVARAYPQLAGEVYHFAGMVEAETEGFVGRGWVLDALARFRADAPAGYFCITADAGLGKTALAAQIARRHAAAAFFFSAPEGYTSRERCLRHLCAELIGRFSLPHPHLPERAGHDWNFLLTLLEEAREKGGEPLLLVIDAVDEAGDAAGALLAPDRLPAGVHVVLTSRTALPIAPRAGTQLHTLRIDADDTRHRADMLDFLRRHAATAAWGPRLRGGGEAFVQRLSEASAGNFMYLRYILADLTAPGADPELFSPGALPRNLTGYYARFWAGMAAVRDHEGWADWNRLYRPTITYLTAALEPVTAQWLAAFVDAPAQEIEERALARWARFLRRHPEQGRWRIVHQSFADFVAGEQLVDLRAAHARVALSALQAWGGVERGLPDLRAEHAADPAHAYGWRHAVRHLRLAGEHDTLAALVEHPAWYEARMRHDPSGTLFQADLEEAWAADDERSRERIAAGRAPDVGREVRRALQVASVNSLSHNLSPELLAALVECGHWSARTALAAVRMNPSGGNRTRAVRALAPSLDAALVLETLQAAPSIPLNLGAGGALLCRLCAVGHAERALDEALSPQRGDEARAELLGALAGALPPPLLARVAETVMELDAEPRRLSSLDPRRDALLEVIRHAPAELLPRLREHNHVMESERSWGWRSLGDAPALRRAELGDWEGAWAWIVEAIPAGQRAVSLGELLRHVPMSGADARRRIAEQGAELLPATDFLARPRAAAMLLPELEPEHALRLAREILAQVQDSSFGDPVARLAPGLPAEAIGEALEVAVRHDGYAREKAVTALARRLVVLGRVPEAVAVARRAGDSYRFGDAMLEILPEMARLGHVEQAVSTAVDLDNLAREQHLPQGVVAVAQHVGQPWLDRLRDRAASIPDPRDRQRALLGIAPRYARLGMPEEALRLARSISDDRGRAELFAVLALGWMRHLGDPDRALPAALAVPDGVMRLRTVEALADALPGHLLRTAVGWLTGKDGEGTPEEGVAESVLRGSALRAVLGALARLGPTEAEEAWEVAERCQEGTRYGCMAAVGASLPEPAQSQRLTAAVEEVIAEWDDDWRQAGCFEALVPALGEGPLRRLTLHLASHPPRQPESLIGKVAERWCELGNVAEAVAATELEPVGYFRGRIVAGIAPFLDAGTVRAFLKSSRSGDEFRSTRAELLPPLLDRLAELGFDGEAVKHAAGLREPKARYRAIARLAHRATPELLAQLRAAVKRPHPDSNSEREWALQAIAIRFARLGESRRALEIADELGFHAADALAGLARTAEGAALEEALERAQKLSFRQAEALAPLLRRLAETQGGDALRRALRIACDVRGDGDRPPVLSALVPALAAAPVAESHALWSQALHTLARHTRTELMADLAALVPVLARLGGADAVESATASLRDVALRWP